MFIFWSIYKIIMLPITCYYFFILVFKLTFTMCLITWKITHKFWAIRKIQNTNSMSLPMSYLTFILNPILSTNIFMCFIYLLFWFIVECYISIWNIKYPHSFSHFLIVFIIISSTSMSSSITNLSDIIESIRVV